MIRSIQFVSISFRLASSLTLSSSLHLSQYVHNCDQLAYGVGPCIAVGCRSHAHIHTHTLNAVCAYNKNEGNARGTKQKIQTEKININKKQKSE